MNISLSVITISSSLDYINSIIYLNEKLSVLDTITLKKICLFIKISSSPFMRLLLSSAIKAVGTTSLSSLNLFLCLSSPEIRGSLLKNWFMILTSCVLSLMMCSNQKTRIHRKNISSLRYAILHSMILLLMMTMNQEDLMNLMMTIMISHLNMIILLLFPF